MKKLKLFLSLLMVMIFSVGTVWGAVVSGTKYSIKGNTMPTDWTGSNTWSGSSTTSYFLLNASSNYVQTDAFCQNGFTKIVVSARKYGGPDGTQEVISVEWIENGSSSPVVLGTVTPTSTSLTEYNINSPASVTGQKEGVIKISCKNASNNKGAGIQDVTISYNSGNCAAADPYTVSFSTGTGNPTQADITEASGGAGITLPAGPTPACDGWTFAGWKETSAVAVETTTAPTLLAAGANYKPAADCTLYAVYKRTESGAVEDASVTETFENQTKGSTYNSTQTYTAANSNAGLAWTMYYGCVSDNVKLTGSQSAQMRWYKSATTTYGYIQNTTPISGLQKVSFNAKTDNANSSTVKVSVWYSTDGKSWTLKEDNASLDGTNKTALSATINGTIGTDYYIRIGVGDAGTAPSSSSAKLTIDDVKFEYKAGAVTNYYLSAPTCVTPPSVTLTPKVIDFGTVYRGESVETQEIAIAGSNLTEAALTFTRKAGEESKFSVALKEGNSLTPVSQLVNAALLVTPNTSEAGEFSDSIRINGGGLGQDTARAFVKINVKERVWTEDGADHDFGTILQYGDKPEPYKFTLKGTHLTPGSEIIINNSLGTNYYVFSPDYVTVDANGEINEEITVSLESTQYPSTMTNTVHVRSNGDADPGVERNLFTVTTAVTIRYEVTKTTDEHGNTFEWVSGTTELEKENNPQYVIPTTFVKATATPAAGYQFDSWNIYKTSDSETKVEHVNGEFNMPSYDVTISGSFSKSVTPDIVVSETELDFGSVDVNSTPVPQTFTITGANLMENVAINWRAEAGYDQDFVTWEVTEGSLTPEGGAVAATVTVTPKTNAVEEFLGELIISSAGATDKHVALYLVVNKLAAGLVWSAEEATVTIDADDNIFPTLTNPNSLAVTYSSNADGVATINAETGAIELVGAGDVTITAASEATATHLAGEVSYTLHVQKKNTVEWYINGVKKGEQKALAGVELAGIPDATLASNGAIFGKVFKGWATAEIEGEVAADAAGVVATPTVMPAADTKYYAVYALETPGEATNHALGSATLKGTASGGNSASSGYALTTNKTNDKSGYTQDSGTKDKDIISLQVKSSSNTQIITSEPSAITVTATLGGGSVKDPLDYPVNAVLVDNSGVSVGDTIILTTKITNTTGSEFTASMPLTNYANVRGFKVFHMKEDSWNVRYYTIALSYTTSAAPTYSKYATSGPKELDVPTFTVAAGTYEETQNIGLEAADGDIYYTLDGTEPTTESTKYTAAIVLDAFGEYTIKAFAAKEDGSRSEVVSATYSMKIPFETVAAMIEYMVDNSVVNETNVTVTGIISQVDQFTSNKITYWISDNGQTNAFEVYLGLGIDGANFDDISDLNVGDKVTVKGNYTLYKETTHEFSANSHLISHTVAEVASVEVVGTAETTEYFYNENVVFDGLTAKAIYNTGYEKDVTANAEWSADPAKVVASGDVTVTATYAGKSGNKVVAVTKKLRAAELAWSAAEAKAYTAGKEYELPSLTNEHGLAIVYSSTVPAVATICEEGVITPLTAGTTVISASFEGNAEYAAQEVTYTLSVVAPTSLVITGDAQAAYEYNETFSFDGLGAKAIYPDEAEYEIPSGDLSAWTATPNRITENGKVKVTVDWATRTSEIREFDVTVLTHDVTFDIPANGTLVVKYNDNPIKSGDHFVKGDELTVVATPASELYELTALTANGINIMEGKSFAIGTVDVEVVATFTLKPFASLEALVAADLDMSVDQEVTVSFSNVEITNFAYGEAFLNVKDKNEKNISIYAGVDVPEEWIVGGKVSGTAIVGLWIYDDDAKYYWLSMYNEWTGISYTKPEAPISWPNNEAVAYTVGKENTWQTLNNEKTLTVSYSSTTPAVATINAETGAITPLTEGTTTIKATYTEDLYLGKEVSYTLNVYAPKSLAISGECKTAYEAGETFDREGLKAIATFGDESVLDVTDLATWIPAEAPVINEDGTLPVGAAWEGLNAAKEITVEVKTHKITFSGVEGQGRVSVMVSEYPIASGDEKVKGTELNVYVLPESNYNATSILVNGVALEGTHYEGDYNEVLAGTYNVGTEDVVITATFEEKPILFYITGNAEALGSWNPAGIASHSESYTLNLPAGDYKMKITIDGTWGTAKGRSDLSFTPAGVSADSDDNICFTLAEAGEVDVYYTGIIFSVTGDFYVEPVDYYLKNNWNGESDWTWKKMTQDGELYKLENVVFGGTGVNYNTTGSDGSGNWMPVTAFLGDEIGALDTVTLVLNPTPGNITITATLIGKYVEPAPKFYIAGSFTSWMTNMVELTQDGDILSAAIELGEKQDYQFKVVKVDHLNNETWYGAEDYENQMKYGQSTDWQLTTVNGGYNINLKTTTVYSYVFQFNPENAKLSVVIPQMPTAIDEVNADEQARKYMLNGQFFIERGGKVYDAQGQLVK